MNPKVHLNVKIQNAKFNLNFCAKAAWLPSIFFLSKTEVSKYKIFFLSISFSPDDFPTTFDRCQRHFRLADEKLWTATLNDTSLIVQITEKSQNVWLF